MCKGGHWIAHGLVLKDGKHILFGDAKKIRHIYCLIWSGWKMIDFDTYGVLLNNAGTKETKVIVCDGILFESVSAIQVDGGEPEPEYPDEPVAEHNVGIDVEPEEYMSPVRSRAQRLIDRIRARTDA